MNNNSEQRETKTSVEYADMTSDVCADMLLDPATDALMSLLSLRWCCYLTSANCPHWLVGNHNSFPVGHVLYVICNTVNYRTALQ